MPVRTLSSLLTDKYMIIDVQLNVTSCLHRLIQSSAGPVMCTILLNCSQSVMCSLSWCTSKDDLNVVPCHLLQRLCFECLLLPLQLLFSCKHI